MVIWREQSVPLKAMINTRKKSAAQFDKNVRNPTLPAGKILRREAEIEHFHSPYRSAGSIA
jgi:hypothetical protein